ncbi:DUF6089 family protein, partial [Fulvivirga kasyanovii]
MKIFVAVLSIGLLGIVGVANSQSFYSYRGGRDVIVSLGTGTSSYFGDLKDPGDYIDAKPNINLGAQYFFNPRLSTRIELNWFQLNGDDSDAEAEGRVVRNLSFSSNNYEVSIVGILNAFPNGRRFYQRPQFNLYGFLGVGGLYFNPKAELNGKKYALQPLATEGVEYSRFTFVVPFGAGVKYKVGPFFNIALEGGYRLTFTDYLDDVSTNYVDNSSFTNPTAAALADRRPEI